MGMEFTSFAAILFPKKINLSRFKQDICQQTRKIVAFEIKELTALQEKPKQMSKQEVLFLNQEELRCNVKIRRNDTRREEMPAK